MIMNWQKIWNDTVNFFQDNVWNIVTFFVVLFCGIIIVKLLVNILRRMLKRTRIEPIAISFMMAIVKFLLYLVLVFVLLDILGIGITWLVTAFSAAFLAIGLALQNNIANMANGIIIVSSGMFKKGDYIGVQISPTHAEYFVVNNDGRNNYDNAHTLWGTVPLYRTVQCSPVDQSEFIA